MFFFWGGGFVIFRDVSEVFDTLYDDALYSLLKCIFEICIRKLINMQNTFHQNDLSLKNYRTNVFIVLVCCKEFTIVDT